MRTLLRHAKRLPDWQLFLLIHTIFVVATLAPLLFRTHLLSGLEYTYPLFQVYTPEALASGSAFMNMLNINGFPSFVGTDFYSMNPFTYIFTGLFPPFDDIHWFITMNMVAGGLFCSILLRRLGYSRAASSIGGMGYIASSWLMIVTSPFVASMPVLPLLALVLLESRKRPVRATVLGAMLCIYIWWAVFIQMTVMLVTSFGVGALVLGWQWRKHGKTAWRPILVYGISMAVGMLSAAPKLMWMIVYADLSWRALGLSGNVVASQGITLLSPIKFLFPYVKFPFLNFGGDILMLYVGIVGFIGLLAALLAATRKRAPMQLRCWALAYAFLFLIAVNQSPLTAVLAYIPPFSLFRGAGRWMLIGSFVAAPLIAHGFDALIHGKAERLRTWLARVLGTIAGLLLAGFIGLQGVLMLFPQQLIQFFQGYFAAFRTSLHLSLPLSYYTAFVERRIHELAAHPLLLEPHTFFPLLSFVVLAIVLQQGVWHKLRHKTDMLVLCALLTSIVTLFWYNDYVPRSAFAIPDTVMYLQHHPGTAVGLLPEETLILGFNGERPSKADQLEWQLEHVVPNTNLFYGTPVLDYFDNVASRRPSALASWVGAHWAGEHWLVGPDTYRIAAVPGSIDDRLRAYVARKNVMNIVGLKYIISAVPLPDPRFKRVFETRITSHQLPIAIYENPDARPIAYFASATETMREDEGEAIKRMLEKRWPGHKSLIECEPDCAPTSPAPGDIMTTLSDTGRFFTVQTHTTKPQWLVVNINRLPGWVVTIDGKPAPSVYANATFFGIRVPEGDHTVVLRFSVGELVKEGMRKILNSKH